MNLCHKRVSFILLDLLLAFFLIFGALAIYYLPPLEQPFRCDDPYIGKPFIEKHRISNSSLLAISYLVPTLTILIGELYSVIKTSVPRHLSCNTKVPMCFSISQLKGFLVRIFHRMTYFILGMAFVMLFIAIGKTISGSPRPHFLEVCKPNITLSNCSRKYLPVSLCTGNKEEVDEARRAFPSGHASIGAYSMVFISLYVEYILVVRKLRLLKPIIQITSIGLALACGLTRVNDFYHSMSDVWIGFILGSAVAIYTVCHVMKLKSHKFQNGTSACQNDKHGEENELNGGFSSKSDNKFCKNDYGVSIPNGKDTRDISCKVVLKSTLLENL